MPPGESDGSNAAIVADDLTGALDCAAAFISEAGGSPPFVALRAEEQPPANCGVLSVNADSRRLSVSEARPVLRNAVEQAGSSGKQLRYVKVDSTLRGHPGFDIGVCAELSDARVVIMSPAFPATGRTVIGDTLLVHGTPLPETDVGNDPLSPAGSSSVTAILASSTNTDVQAFSLDTVRSGQLAAEIESLLARTEGSAPIIACCDAETNADLDSLVDAGTAIERAVRSYGRVLFAGSAGLAFALGRATLPVTPVEPFTPRLKDAPVLVVTASQRSLADRQLESLAERNIAELLRVSFEATGSAVSPPGRRTSDALADAIRRGRNVLVRAVVDGGLDHLTATEVRGVADEVTGQLANIITGVVSEHPIGGLVIIGGDTAYALLKTLEARGIVLQAEPLPGLPLGTITGGILDGVSVATKAGAFGDEMTLVKLFTYLGHESI